jgi:hypothetical protein
VFTAICCATEVNIFVPPRPVHTVPFVEYINTLLPAVTHAEIVHVPFRYPIPQCIKFVAIIFDDPAIPVHVVALVEYAIVADVAGVVPACPAATQRPFPYPIVPP